MTIGEKIKELRGKKGISQEELGAAIGMSAKAISAWENNSKTPRMGAVEHLAEYFDVPKTYLIDDTLSTSDLPKILAAGGLGLLVGGPLGAAIAGVFAAVGNLSNAVSDEKSADVGVMVLHDTTERRMVEAFRNLSDADKAVILSMLHSLAEKNAGAQKEAAPE